MATSIRAASPDDRDDLSALMLEQMREHGMTVDETALRDAIGHALDHPDVGLFLVAAGADGRPAGAAYVAFLWSLEHAGAVAWLEELYVLPRHRGEGLGRELVRAACSEAAARGCPAMDLEVDSGHERAAALYVREGFRRLARTRWVRPLR